MLAHALNKVKGIKSWVRHDIFTQYYCILLVNDKTLFLSDTDIETIVNEFEGDILSYKAFFDDMYCEYR